MKRQGKDWRENTSKIYINKGHVLYQEILQLNKEKYEKLAKAWTLYQENIQIINKYMKRHLASLVIGKCKLTP